MRNSLKMQDEVWGRWGGWLHPENMAQDWPKRFAGIANVGESLRPMLQKQTQEVFDLIGKSTQAADQLRQKATEAAQTTALSESQSKWLEFWKFSLETTFSNADALIQMDQRAVNSWMDFVGKNVVQPQACKA